MRYFDPKERKDFEQLYGKVNQEQAETLAWLLSFADAIKGRSITKLRDAVAAYAKTFRSADKRRSVLRSLPIYKTLPLKELSASFNLRLHECRLVVWWSDIARRLTVGLYCEDATTALFALALSRLGEAGSLGICKRCRKFFVRRKPSKRFCSSNCQSADAMARYRNRERRKSKKKGKQ